MFNLIEQFDTSLESGYTMNWKAVHLSAEGNKLMAVSHGGKIWAYRFIEKDPTSRKIKASALFNRIESPIV